MRASVLILLALIMSPFAGAVPIPLAKPGNLQASFTRDSVNHILGFAVPIAGYYLWGGGIEGKIPIGYRKVGTGYTLEVNSLKFNPIDPYTSATLEWVDDTDSPTMELKITNITLDAHLDVRIYLGWIIPMWGAHLATKDLDITLDISVDKVYDVYPQIYITPKLEALKIDYGFFIFGWLIRLFLKQDKLMSIVEDVLTSQVANLNKMFKNPQPDSYLVGLLSQLLLNIGPTRPFDISEETDLIEFGLDGRIFDSETKQYKTKDCEKLADRFDRSHSNQIFLHESTAEDIFKGVMHNMFPLVMESQEFTQLLGIYIPELTDKYGLDGFYRFSINMDDKFRLHFTEENGIELLGTGLTINIEAKGRTGWRNWEDALTFTVHADFNSIDLTMQDLIIMTHIHPVTVKESYLTFSKIGDVSRNNWDQFFEGLFNMMIAQINVNNKEFDIKSLDQ